LPSLPSSIPNGRAFARRTSDKDRAVSDVAKSRASLQWRPTGCMESLTLSTTNIEPNVESDARSPLEKRAGWWLAGPLTCVVAVLCLGQLLMWIPSYLTWPWWADHDVFGTAAFGWEHGQKPYRDLKGNNFPGTIYLFWALGRVFGWGNPTAFYAFDATLVVALGLLLVAWSRRCFGQLLPGLVGYGTFLSYYLSLDYTQAGQRDWHGPFFAVAGILIVQIAPDWRFSRFVGGVLTALGLFIRPQVLLFIPAMLVALSDGMRRQTDAEPTSRQTTSKPIHAWLEWGVACAAGLFLLTLPLLYAGLLTDFVRALRHVGLGSRYNRLSIKQFSEQMLPQILPFRFWVVALFVVSLGRVNTAFRRYDPGSAWLAATLFVLFYRPLSPTPHAYLGHPLALTWSILVAVSVGRLEGFSSLSRPARLGMIVLVMGLGMSLKPRFSNPNGSLHAIADLRHGGEPILCPPGYVPNFEVPSAAKYPWEDYRELLGYLRKTTSPDTPIANVLKHVPAITSATPRPSVFPAESIAWLIMIDQEGDAQFAEALRRSPNAVVVWAPSEKNVPGLIEIPILTNVIEELYELHHRFGLIEVWRRKVKPPSTRGPAPPEGVGGRTSPAKN
jgi:hypothetical protein